MFKLQRSSAATSSSSSTPTFLNITNIVLRFLQFVFAITVCGLYGTDLHNARKMEVEADSRWIYAEVVGGLSAVTALVFAAPFLKSYWLFAWDGVLLWVNFLLLSLFSVSSPNSPGPSKYLTSTAFFPFSFLSSTPPSLPVCLTPTSPLLILVHSILWTALFGIFGKLFIHIPSREADRNSALKRMKNAVWIDLVNMLLWLVTALLSAALFLKYRSSRSLHTGRAKV